MRPLLPKHTQSRALYAATDINFKGHNQTTIEDSKLSTADQLFGRETGELASPVSLPITTGFTLPLRVTSGLQIRLILGLAGLASSPARPRVAELWSGTAIMVR